MPNGSRRPWYKDPRWWGTIIALLGVLVAIIVWRRPHEPTDFNMSIDPLSGETEPGGVPQTLVDIKGVGGYKYAVRLSAGGQPLGVIVTFIPVGGPKPPYSSTMTITVGSNVPAGSYTIVIKGEGGDGREHACKYNLTVRPPLTPVPTASTIPTPTPSPSPTLAPTPTPTLAPTVKQYTLTTSVNPSAGGTVNPSSGSYKEGTPVMLTAMPSSNYLFDHWSSTDGDSINPTKVTMTGDKNVTAYFKPVPFGVAIIEPPNKSVVPQPVTVRGNATSEVPKTQYLWVVVQYGQEVWPQTYRVTPVFRSITKTYEWSVDAQVGMSNDSGKTFGIGALLVPQSIDDDFLKWFDTSKKTGQWLGFDLGKLLARGAVMLDTVSVKRE